VRLGGARALPVLEGLFDPFGQRPLEALPEDLQFDRDHLGSAGAGPCDEQVGPAPAEPVFPFDPAAAVDHALEERLEQELGPGLLVIEPLQPVFRVLPEELLEGGEEPVQVEPAVLGDIPGRFLDHGLLGGARQLAGDDLPVDGIGQLEGRPLPDQSQVHRIVDVVGGDIPGSLAAGQKRLDHPPHARFLQLVGELVEMGLPTFDEGFLGLLDHRGGHAPVSGAAREVPEAALVGQGVDQPGLPLGEVPDERERIGLEALPGLRGVLAEEFLDLAAQEITEPKRFSPDVEGASARDHRLAIVQPEAVIPHVPDSAEDDALGEGAGPAVVAGPEMPQHRDQRVPHQAVDLVEEQHERPGEFRAPAVEEIGQ